MGKVKATNQKEVPIVNCISVDNHTDTQPHSNEAVHDIDLVEVHNNYLKLISGTSLKEEQDRHFTHGIKYGKQSDSSGEEGEESSLEDMDYVDEENSEDSEEYASVDS